MSGAPGWIAIGISGVSVLIALGSLWYTRGQKQAADRSATAAEYSASASATAAALAAEDVAIERERRKEEIAKAEKDRVRFTLAETSATRYELVNRGTDSAYGVQVEVGGVVVDTETEFDEFPRDHKESIVGRVPLGSITVTWHQRPDLGDAPQQRVLKRF